MNTVMHSSIFLALLDPKGAAPLVYSLQPIYSAVQPVLERYFLSPEHKLSYLKN